MASSAVGEATLDFGAAPGTNIAEVAVTGQTSLGLTALCEAFVMGDSTADHNVVEHQVAPIKLTCGALVAGTGFTITGVTEWRLTGTFKVRWVWTGA